MILNHRTGDQHPTCSILPHALCGTPFAHEVIASTFALRFADYWFILARLHTLLECSLCFLSVLLLDAAALLSFAWEVNFALLSNFFSSEVDSPLLSNFFSSAVLLAIFSS